MPNLEAARRHLEAIKAYDDDMNAREFSPTGDDYNEIFSWAMAALEALKDAEEV